MIIFIILGAILIPLWLILSGIAKEPMVAKNKNKTKEYILVDEEYKAKNKDNDENNEDEYFCPQCGQSCSKEEYKSGFCLDCDMGEMELDV